MSSISDKFWDATFYFRRGHSTTTGVVIQLGTFYMIAYGFFGEDWIMIFSIIVGIITFGVFAGVMDYNYWSFKRESKKGFDANPRMVEMLERIKNIEERVKLNG